MSNKEFVVACYNGNLKAATHFITSIFSLEEGFRCACANGHLDIAQLILHTNPNIDIASQYDYAFRYACKNNHSHVAEWLCSLRSCLYQLSYDANGKTKCGIRKEETVFREACLQGYLDTAKWILKLKPNVKIGRDVLGLSLYFYRLEEAKWLTTVRTHFDYQDAFRCAYSTDQFEAVKWLLEIKPDIDITASDHYAFRCACRRNNMAMVKLFQSLKPNIYEFKYDDRGKMVCIVRYDEINWQKRKHAVWMASDNAPNKNNIMYKLPIDLSRVVANFI
jgi:ankyrin repeat protein